MPIVRPLALRATLPTRLTTSTLLHRRFSFAQTFLAEGDTGAMRRGGSAQDDTWTRREKAAENMYIKQREKEIVKLLKEKIKAQEAILENDRKVLAVMEDQYGRAVEDVGRASAY
jgi:hypothetical protein